MLKCLSSIVVSKKKE